MVRFELAQMIKMSTEGRYEDTYEERRRKRSKEQVKTFAVVWRKL